MRLGIRMEVWPSEIRAAAATSGISVDARRAIGRHLGWADREGVPAFEAASIAAYVSFLESALRPKRLAEVLSNLSQGLVALEPKTDWAWILARRRAAGRDARSATSLPKKRPGGRKRLFSLPISDWPAVYRDRWQTAIDPGTARDPFGEFAEAEGPFAKFSNRRRRQIVDSWGMFLQCALDATTDPALEPRLVRKFVSALQKRGVQPRTISGYLSNINDGATALAPAADLHWLRNEANRFFAESKHHPKRKDGRVVSGHKLLALGLILCDEARRRHPALVSTAVLFRDGLMIALLAVAPARISNFASIEIGRHLDMTSAPGHLKWSASETKQGREQSHRLPLDIRKLLDEYIAVYRKVLLDGYGGDHLWLTEHGGRPLKQGSIRKQIKKHSLDRLKVDVTPHLFRDAVAVTVSERAPDEMEIATSVLRHGSAEATKPYREQASTISAATVAQEAIEADRHDQARNARAARRQRAEDEPDDIFCRFL